MKFSLVIVTWNTKRIVRECLDSVRGYAGINDSEVIVVDNASSDGTPDLIAAEFPAVTLVRNPVNSGFARGNNLGIERSRGEYVCLVNSDVVVPPGCLERMADFMDAHPDVGMLGPKMILPDGSIGQSCFRFPTVWNWFCRALALDRLLKNSRLFGGYLMADFDYAATSDVEGLTGWFWMVRRDALRQVGHLDESFFMYGEDIDWSKRFHKAGWRVVFYSGAHAIHYCGASSSNAPARFYVEMIKANLQYCRRHHEGIAVLGFTAVIWLHEVIRLVGYGITYALSPRRRADIAAKVKRSAACLRWLALKRAVVA